jgi:PPOX class probable F420-dependent enzyme
MRASGSTKGGARTDPSQTIPQVPDELSMFGGKYLSITSYKRDGSAVATPVWFVHDVDRLLVETDGDSGKANRIRHNPRVMVATCSAGGKVRRTPVEARAEILPDLERTRADRLFARKYRIDRITVMPIYRAVQFLLHGPRRRATPVVMAITRPDHRRHRIAA